MGRVPQLIGGELRSYWMRGRASEKLSVSFGLIPQVEGQIPCDCRGKRPSVCWKTQGDIGKTSSDVYGILQVQLF